MAGIAQIVRNASPGGLAADAASMAVDACPNAMVLTDGDGRIVLVNAETERLFGYAREELIGDTIEVLLPERLREGHVRARRECTLNPAPRRSPQHVAAGNYPGLWIKPLAADGSAPFAATISRGRDFEDPANLISEIGDRVNNRTLD